MGRPVPPWRFESILEAAVRQLLHTIGGHRRTQRVLAEPQQAIAVRSTNGDSGVQVKAVCHCAARGPALEVLFRVFVVKCSKCSDLVSGIRSLDDSSTHGCAVNGRESIVRSILVVPRLKQNLHTLGDTVDNSPDIASLRRSQRIEPRTFPFLGGINPIESNHVKVRRQIQSGSEPLDKGQGAALSTKNAPVTSLPPEPSKH